MYQIITDTSALFTPEEGKAMGIEVLDAKDGATWRRI